MSETKKTCFNCRSEALVEFFPLGGYCQPCVDKRVAWQEQRRLEREAERKAQALHKCGEEIEGAADLCSECCEHEFDPDEGYMCLHCGKDGAEDVACAAEAWADSLENR